MLLQRSVAMIGIIRGRGHRPLETSEAWIVARNLARLRPAARQLATTPYRVLTLVTDNPSVAAALEPPIEPVGHLVQHVPDASGGRVAMRLSGISDEAHRLAEPVERSEQLLALGERRCVVHVSADDQHRRGNRFHMHQRTGFEICIPVPVRWNAEMSLPAFGPAWSPELLIRIVRKPARRIELAIHADEIVESVAQDRCLEAVSLLDHHRGAVTAEADSVDSESIRIGDAELYERIHRGKNVTGELARAVGAAAGQGHARLQHHVSTRRQQGRQPVVTRLRIRRCVAALLGLRMDRPRIHLHDQRISRTLAVSRWHGDAREYSVSGASRVTHVPRATHIELGDVLVERYDRAQRLAAAHQQMLAGVIDSRLDMRYILSICKRAGCRRAPGDRLDHRRFGPEHRTVTPNLNDGVTDQTRAHRGIVVGPARERDVSSRQWMQNSPVTQVDENKLGFRAIERRYRSSRCVYRPNIGRERDPLCIAGNQNVAGCASTQRRGSEERATLTCAYVDAPQRE